MSEQNNLDKIMTINHGSDGLTVESASGTYLAQLRSYGLIDDKNQITTMFVDTLSAFVALPLYQELVQALAIPLDVVIIRDMLDMLINNKAEHAIYVLFELIYSFSKTPMPQALGALTKGGLMMDFAAFFLADLTEIIQEDFEDCEVTENE